MQCDDNDSIRRITIHDSPRVIKVQERILGGEEDKHKKNEELQRPPVALHLSFGGSHVWWLTPFIRSPSFWY